MSLHTFSLKKKYLRRLSTVDFIFFNVLDDEIFEFRGEAINVGLGREAEKYRWPEQLRNKHYHLT